MPGAACARTALCTPLVPSFCFFCVYKPTPPASAASCLPASLPQSYSTFFSGLCLHGRAYNTTRWAAFEEVVGGFTVWGSWPFVPGVGEKGLLFACGRNATLFASDLQRWFFCLASSSQPSGRRFYGCVVFSWPTFRALDALTFLPRFADCVPCVYVYILPSSRQRRQCLQTGLRRLYSPAPADMNRRTVSLSNCAPSSIPWRIMAASAVTGQFCDMMQTPVYGGSGLRCWYKPFFYTFSAYRLSGSLHLNAV